MRFFPLIQAEKDIYGRVIDSPPQHMTWRVEPSTGTSFGFGKLSNEKPASALYLGNYMAEIIPCDLADLGVGGVHLEGKQYFGVSCNQLVDELTLVHVSKRFHSNWIWFRINGQTCRLL
jgi:hypothetical protein